MSINILSRETLTQNKPKIAFPAGLNIRDHVREIDQGNGQLIHEFIGTDSFGAEWQTRQRYEVDAGRVEEPLLYQPIYDIINDATLPKNVSVNQIGPGGVVFEEVFEGGEVKFSSVTSAEFSVPIRHWATGLEYSDDLLAFNELWRVPVFERAMGIAHNALENHLHLSPIISANYQAANQTAFVTTGDSDAEDVFLTIQAGITASRTDTTNPRRGPYILLVSSADLFRIEMALTRVGQLGFTRQSSAISMVTSVIAYDGWTGTRGKKVTTYTGVTAGKAYLINTGYRGMDFQSYVKEDLVQYGTQEDVSRFLTQVIYHSRLGVFANPLRAVEELTIA
jgi:hypothetical protein